MFSLFDIQSLFPSTVNDNHSTEPQFLTAKSNFGWLIDGYLPTFLKFTSPCLMIKPTFGLVKSSFLVVTFHLSMDALQLVNILPWKKTMVMDNVYIQII